jgi:hypothetical protein
MAHVALLKVLLRVLVTTGHSLGGKVGAYATRHKLRVGRRWGRRGFEVSANLHGKTESGKALVSGMRKMHEEMYTHEPGKPILMASHPRRSQRLGTR